MFTKRELISAIKECENAPSNYLNIEKLAHLYTVYDHLFAEGRTETVEEVKIGAYGDSDFLQVVQGADSQKVWSVLEEMMEALAVLNPKLYNSTMERLKGSAIL